MVRKPYSNPKPVDQGFLAPDLSAIPYTHVLVGSSSFPAQPTHTLVWQDSIQPPKQMSRLCENHLSSQERRLDSLLVKDMFSD